MNQRVFAKPCLILITEYHLYNKITEKEFLTLCSYFSRIKNSCRPIEEMNADRSTNTFLCIFSISRKQLQCKYAYQGHLNHHTRLTADIHIPRLDYHKSKKKTPQKEVSSNLFMHSNSWNIEFHMIICSCKK